VNSEHLVEVAKIVRSLGAYVLDIVPFASNGLGGVSAEELGQIRRDCENVCTSEVQLYVPSPTLGCISAGMQPIFTIF
jgi:hypothetical protein